MNSTICLMAEEVPSMACCIMVESLFSLCVSKPDSRENIKTSPFIHLVQCDERRVFIIFGENLHLQKADNKDDEKDS